MTGPVAGVLFVNADSAKHLHDLEHDLALEHAELCAYRAALTEIAEAANEAAITDAIGANAPAAILQNLIDIINRAVPGPSDPGSAP